MVSTTFQDHFLHLREAFTCFGAALLCLKPKKYECLEDRVPFLGNAVSTAGIEPDSVKTEKIT